MTDQYQKTPRRPPLVQEPVPGPNDSPISARAIALREAQREKTVTEMAPPGPAIRDTKPLPDYTQALQAGMGNAPFARPFGPVGNIAGAIANVMAHVGTIEKGGFNAFHKYHYARMEDLLVVLTPLMGQNGLAVIQNEVLKEVLEGNRLAVTYEFSIFHKSGEFWPERPRFTGMSIGRDSKGNWDDKAINKCHTSARKYFLLALFQVPSGDFEEADADANQRQVQQPVPGPGSMPIEEKPAPVERKPMDGGPYKIVLGQGSGPEQWASAYIQEIGKAKTKEELQQWDAFNGAALQSLYVKYPTTYDQLIAATTRRLAELDRSSMKDPIPKDPAEAMNWIAEQLQQFKEYEAAEQFWNTIVAPREKDFDTVDWDMLMSEWRRTETRLSPPDDDVTTVQGLG